MKLRSLSIVALSLLVIWLVSPDVFNPSWGAVPDTITIQGTLEAPEEGPLTGTHDYRIRFYPQETGGGFVAAVTGTVTLSSSGRFFIDFVPPQILLNDELWYDLAIDTGDDGIFPDDLYPTRVRIQSVPFALKAGDAEALGGKPALDYVTDQNLTSKAWLIGGNAGTAGQSLGTTDLQSLYLQVNNQTAFTLVPGSTVPSVLGGYGGNVIGANVEGGTISGGGRPTGANQALSDFATVGGGSDNTAVGKYSVVPGGSLNSATGDYSFVAGRRARAAFQGSFVWADSVDADFFSNRENEFAIRAKNGLILDSENQEFAAEFTNRGNGDGIRVYANTSEGFNYAALYARNSGSSPGIYASSTGGGPAAVFIGDIDVSGNVLKAAGGSRIDHPVDPENKTLSHWSVESPELKNVYDGVAVLDSNGEAWVELPDWFEALNGDFRYQLTCVGAFSPVYIAEEIANNRFRIAGGAPEGKVCWQVTGVRRDPYAKSLSKSVEKEKPANEKGAYLQPAAYGLPKSKGLYPSSKK